MKQNIKLKTLAGLLPAFIASVLAVASCAKNEADIQNRIQEEKVGICITSDFNDLSSDAELTKAFVYNTFAMRWSGGETVYVYGVEESGTDIKCLGSLRASVVSGTDNRVADLGGSITKPEDGTLLSLVYSPALNSQPAVSSNAISIDLSSQNGEADDVTFVAFATVTYGGATNAGYRTAFNFATNILRVNLSNLAESTALESAVLGDIETGCRLEFSANAGPSISGCYYDDAKTIYRTFTGSTAFSSNAKGNAAFYIAIPKISDNAGRVLKVTQEGMEYIAYGFASSSSSYGMVLNSIASCAVLPAGALPGVFSVSATKKVHFSQGNLTYDVYATTDKWKFFEHQYDCAENGSASETLISLFTWGYGDWSTNPTTENYLTSHTSNGEPFDQSEDWGSRIGDGKTWSTLSTLEWQYLFNTRVMANGGVRYENLTSSGVTVESVLFKGVVLFPDDFTEQETWKTKCTTWEAINNAGLVFLPAAGYRYGSDVSSVGVSGYYWSSSAFRREDIAFNVYFVGSDVNPDHLDARYLGYSVRLITEIK